MSTFDAPIRREKAKAYIIAAKDGVPCADCGVAYPQQVMEFDHRDPSEKDIDVSAMVRQRHSVKRIQKEIDKCDIVCSNCHRMRTFGLTPPRRRGIMSRLRSLF